MCRSVLTPCLLRGIETIRSPALPILFKYNTQCHNPAWTIINEPWHFLRLMCQFSNTVDVTILPVCVPTDAETSSPERYAENVRRLMAERLEVALVDQSQGDLALVRSGIHVSFDGNKVLRTAA